MNLDAKDVFESPNPPVSAYTGNGSQQHKGKGRGHKRATQPRPPKEVEAIRTKKKIPSWKKKRMIADFVIKDLSTIGSFHTTPEERQYFFNQQDKRLLQISADNLDFIALIGERYGLNPTELEFRYTLAEMVSHALKHGQKTEVYKFAHYDKKSGQLYISNHNHRVFRLDGEKNELVENGTDGVMFEYNRHWQEITIQEFDPEKYAGGDPPLWTHMVGTVNFTRSGDTNLSPDEQRSLFYVWLHTLFFESLLPAKPILLLLGEKGSGKTSTLKRLLRLYFGKRVNVSPITKEDAFDAAISSNYLACFDNADTRVAWLNDKLATCSTGQDIVLRELYTTNREARFPTRCFLALTARTPKFKRDDVVDRLLVFKVDRIEEFKPESSLLEEIEDNRDTLWGELLYNLNKIVAALKTDHEAFTTPFRLADFASLGWRIARVGSEQDGDEWKEVLSKCDRERHEFLLEDDSLVAALSEWLQQDTNNGRQVDAKTLFDELKKIANDSSIDFDYKSPQALAMRLRNVEHELREFFKVETIGGRTAGTARKLYKFTRK